MLEREVVTHLNELTPRNVDSWRGWPEKVAVFFDEIKENNKSVFTTHSQILSTVYNMFHLRSERINLYYISTYLAFSLFSPPQREPTIFQWLEWDTSLRCEVFLYQFVIWKCFNLPLRSVVVISKKHLFTKVKKNKGLASKCYSFHPAKILRSLDGASTQTLESLYTRVFTFLFFFWQLNLWWISPVQINCLLARAPWDWKLFTPHRKENNKERVASKDE